MDPVTYGNSTLTYTVGLLTTAESALLGNKTVQATGSRYWNLTPHNYNHVYVDAKYIKEDGSLGSNDWARENFGVRPAILLKPGTTFKDETDGTASNSYEIE